MTARAPSPLKPRLLLNDEARDYLAGVDPRTLGVEPITTHPLRFDIAEINAALDARFLPQAKSGQREGDDGLQDLENKIAGLE